MGKKKKIRNVEEEYIRINKKISREEEMALLGPGFHCKDRVHKSKKTYSRKLKHKGGDDKKSLPFKI